MATTLYDLQCRRADMHQSFLAKREEAVAMAMNAGNKIDDVRAAQRVVDELQERITMLDKEIATHEAAAREKMQREKPQATMSFEDAAGAYFSALANGGNLRGLPKMAYEQLGEIPAANADQGNGSTLLPKQLANRLLLAPEAVNPLRKRMGVTNVTGLSMPKLAFTVADDAFVTKAGATAKEIAQNAETIDFGRHKAHFIANVSTTLLRNSPLDLQSAILRGLDGAMNAKELGVIFAETPATGEEHMSLYSGSAVSAIEGDSLLTGIIGAAGDLEDEYQQNASVAMRRQDYYTMMMALTNGAEALFTGKPAQILGYPVDFVSKAVIPVVGDFRFLHINYDSTPYLDRDKSAKTDITTFSEVATYDIHRLMDAAFRLAKVKGAA